MAESDITDPAPAGQTQLHSHSATTPLDEAILHASMLVTPLQNMVTKLGQILQAMGTLAGAYAIKSIAHADSPYTTLSMDNYLLVDATAGAVSINLSANGNPQISVMQIDASGNNVTLVGTINGAVNLITNTQYLAHRCKRDNSGNWWLF